MPHQPPRKCLNESHYLPANARSKKRKPLDLALLSGTGVGIVPISIVTLDSGILFRLGERGTLALGGGFGSLAATASRFVGLVLGRRFGRDSFMAGFQGVDMLSHGSSAVAYTSSYEFVQPLRRIKGPWEEEVGIVDVTAWVYSPMYSPCPIA